MTDMRLSDYLASLSGGEERFPSGERPLLARLQKTLSQYYPASDSKTTPTSSSGGGRREAPAPKLLTWGELKKGVSLRTPADNEEASGIRQKLQSLIRSIGQAVESGELAEHAMHVYTVLNDPSLRREERHALVRRQYPSQKPQFYASLCGLVSSLADWRLKHLGSPLIPLPSKHQPTTGSASSTATDSSSSSPNDVTPSSSSSSSSSPSTTSSSFPVDADIPTECLTFDAGEMDETWLLRSCELYCAGGGEAGGYMLPSESSTRRFSILKQDITNEHIMESLLGLLGIEAIEFAQHLLGKRLALLEMAFGGPRQPAVPRHGRSEERRVGKEGRSRGG